MKKFTNKLRRNEKRFRKFLIGKKKLRLIWQVRAAFENYYNGVYEDTSWYEDMDVSFGHSVCIQEPQTKLTIKELGIRYITIKDKGKEIILTICLERPGLFIGRGGSEIDNLKTYMATSMNKPINFNIIESRGVWEDQKETWF